MSDRDIKSIIDAHRFGQSLKPVRLFIFIVGVFNLFLLIPDLINVGGTSATYVLILRVGYAVLAAVFLYSLKRIRTFHVLAILVTLMEILAIIQFLFVLILYPSPDFMIQLLAMMILLVFVLIVPNYWSLTVFVACLGAAAFLALASSIFTENTAQLVPGSVYLGLLVIIGTVYKGYLLHNQKRDVLRIARMENILGTDPLTNTGNRNMLNEMGDDLIEKLTKKGLSLALIFMDVDDLKHINDAFGHKHGDMFLKGIAATVRSHLRHDDICVRWGGDEFILFLPGVSLSDAVNLAERIRQALQVQKYKNNIAPSCSFGVAILKSGQTLESLIEEADKAMYEAKGRGKNRVVISAPSVAY